MTQTESAVFVVGVFDVSLAAKKHEQDGRTFETAGAVTFALPQGTTLFGKATKLLRVTFFAHGGARHDAVFNTGDSSWNCEVSAHSLAAWIALLGSSLRKELRVESLTEGHVTASLLAAGGR